MGWKRSGHGEKRKRSKGAKARIKVVSRNAKKKRRKENHYIRVSNKKGIDWSICSYRSKELAIA